MKAKRICLALVAHVDAGKTTLSENILFRCGIIKKAGRVDDGETALDSHELERARGITIFSSRAHFSYGGIDYNLIDTPGHTDFSAEMERSLSVLDYAVVLVSGAEGVQAHTHTLWKLLEQYRIPTFVFVNKMDRAERSREEILRELRSSLSAEIAEVPLLSSGAAGNGNAAADQFRETLLSGSDDQLEEIAMCDEHMMNRYLETGEVLLSEVKDAVRDRKLFPVCFGSALRDEGVDTLLDLISGLAVYPEYGETFAARVYKITHDSQHNRFTHMKILGGTLRIRDKVGEEKITRMRLYDGEAYEEVTEAEAGTIVSVMGLTETYPGMGIGVPDTRAPILEPVMSYRMFIPFEESEAVMMDRMKELEEEDPQLSVTWNEELSEIHISVMGVIQLEILKSVIKERFGVDVSFGAGRIVYKETIMDTVEGVGHFEPLRHYAEVHLLMEPGPRGSGITCSADLSEDSLAVNWQRLILTHIMEKKHRGVVLGAELTDVKITLKAGRAHLKHTEGGDFRQATYRAVRQGLMQATSMILEPYYDFEIRLPQEYLGHAMNDIDGMQGSCEPPVIEGTSAILRGNAPASTMWDYQKELTAYTRGYGSMMLTLHGYERCHNSEEVAMASYYDPDRDIANPTGSVFCAHGAGFPVPWYEVPQYMHLESIFGIKRDEQGVPVTAVRTVRTGEWLDPDEVDAIIRQAGGANRREKGVPKKDPYHRTHSKTVIGGDDTLSAAARRKAAAQPAKPKYLLVDGYNIIFAWEELRELANRNVDAARLELCDIISNYAGFREIDTAVVFDAYRLENHKTEMSDYHNIKVVFTATAETADHYIERFTHDNAKKYDITVATSDGLEQIIIRSQGCLLLSATGLMDEVRTTDKEIREIIKS